MPRLLLLSALLMLALPASTVHAQRVPEPAHDARVLPYPMQPPQEFVRALDAGTRSATGAPGPTYWQQRSEYALKVRLFPESNRIEGSGTIRYHNESPDTLYELHLEMVLNVHAEGAVRNSPMEVTGGIELTGVRLNGAVLGTSRREDAAYSVDGTQLILYPADPVMPGSVSEIGIDWSAQIPARGASGRMGHSRDDLFMLAYWYPTMSVYDDVVGWQTDPFLGRSEFYTGFAHYDVTIEAPAGWLIQATGVLLNSEDVLQPEIVARRDAAHRSFTPQSVAVPQDFEKGRVTTGKRGATLAWHFAADSVRAFVFAAMHHHHWDAARLALGSADSGRASFTEINTFYRPTAPRWKNVTTYQQQSLAFLSAFTGLLYPYPQMSAVEGSGIIGGGMEFPMMTMMGDYNAAGDASLYGVTVHELGHMWIPMIVATDERRTAWMDEGTTTFNENNALASLFKGTNPYLTDQATYLMTARSGEEGEIMRRSNYHYSSRAYGNASYSKPGSVLHALRGVLGEEVFNAGYKTFFSEWAFRHPYPYDLFNTFERVSGRDLDWFWRSWYYETWTLDQAVADVQASGDHTTITIEDRGGIPMPVYLVATTASGDAIRRQIPVDVWLAGARTATLDIETTDPIVSVQIDPELYFPDVDLTNNFWSLPVGAR